MNGSVRFIDIDDPNAVAGHVWTHAPDTAERTTYQGVEGECATVTVGGLQFAVGFDPSEDGILWAVNADTGDGSQFEQIGMGGWAPGDRGTAESEIGAVLEMLNGGK